MPKAMRITESNLPQVREISGWELPDDDVSLFGMYFVEDVQFPHGYVDQAIVTQTTFEATFDSPSWGMGLEQGMTEVVAKTGR